MCIYVYMYEKLFMTLQHTATNATHCTALQRTNCRAGQQGTATHCNTLQHTTTCCNNRYTLHHAATNKYLT